jgi:ATP-dependent Clp protease ATP-binding subunit ClpA
VDEPLDGLFGGTAELADLGVDLTGLARRGDLEPVRCRDAEVARVIDILLRQAKNNPGLVGEAGVGKTAIVEGLAQRIAAGDVPPALKDARSSSSTTSPCSPAPRSAVSTRSGSAVWSRRWRPTPT